MKQLYSIGLAGLIQVALEVFLPAATPRVWVIGLAGMAGILWSGIDARLTQSPQEIASDK